MTSWPRRQADDAVGLIALGTAVVALQMEERHSGDQMLPLWRSTSRAVMMVSVGIANQSAQLEVDGKSINLAGELRCPIYLFDGTINEDPAAIQVRRNGIGQSDTRCLTP